MKETRKQENEEDTRANKDDHDQMSVDDKDEKGASDEDKEEETPKTGKTKAKAKAKAKEQTSDQTKNRTFIEIFDELPCSLESYFRGLNRGDATAFIHAEVERNGHRLRINEQAMYKIKVQREETQKNTGEDAGLHM